MKFANATAKDTVLEITAPLANILNMFNITLRRWRPFSGDEKKLSSRKTHVRTNCVRVRVLMRATHKIKSSKLRAKLHKVFMQYYTYKMDHYMDVFCYSFFLCCCCCCCSFCEWWIASCEKRCSSQLVRSHSIPAQSSIINVLKFIQIKMLFRFLLLHHRPTPQFGWPTNVQA